MIKLVQTFEKLGYATDPYLGNLTVSPKYLGTALQLEASVVFEHKKDAFLDKDVIDEIQYARHIKVTNRLDTQHLHTHTRDILLQTE